MQDFLVMAVVGIAGLFLGLKLIGFFSPRKHGGGCGHCGCHEKKPDATIGKKS